MDVMYSFVGFPLRQDSSEESPQRIATLVFGMPYVQGVDLIVAPCSHRTRDKR